MSVTRGKSNGGDPTSGSVANSRKNSAPDRKATRSHRRVPHCYVIAFIFTFVSFAPPSFARGSLFRGLLKSPLYRRFQCTNLKKGARLFHFSLSLFFPAPANLPVFVGPTTIHEASGSRAPLRGYRYMCSLLCDLVSFDLSTRIKVKVELTGHKPNSGRFGL